MERKAPDEGERNNWQKERETFDRIKREPPTEKGQKILSATIAQEIWAISGQESPNSLSTQPSNHASMHIVPTQSSKHVSKSPLQSP